MSGTRSPKGQPEPRWNRDRKVYETQIPLPPDPVTGRRRREWVRGPDKTAVRAEIRRRMTEIGKTGAALDRQSTVAQIMDAYLANPPASWNSHITVRRNKDMAQVIKAHLGHLTLAKLGPGPDRVDAFLRQLASEGYGTQSIREHRWCLARAIKRLEQAGKTVGNPAALAESPRGQRRQLGRLRGEGGRGGIRGNRPSWAMTWAQLETLLAYDRLDTWWNAYVRTGACCGLRPGELGGLTWANVDFRRGYIRVWRALHEEPDPETGKLTMVLGDLKQEYENGSRARRSVAMDSHTAAALKARHRQQAEERVKAGPLYEDRDLVFAGPAGKPRWASVLNDAFRKLCARAGIGAGHEWCRKELRHTYVSLSSDGGEDMEKIADAAGHRSSIVTRSVYRHQVSPLVGEGSAAIFEERLSG